jgi:hypothetical protein
MTRRQLFQTFAAIMITVCLLVLSRAVLAQGNSDNAFERVKAVQEQHTGELMAQAGVIGTAIGLDDQGEAAVLVLLENAGVGGIPETLDGVPVQPIVTGKIEALAKPSGKPGGGGGGSTPSPTSVWPRPVPIGVSTGNAGECSAGTISCRVKDASGNVYALSNNHVYALENTALTGSQVLQPGRYDTQCAYDAANVIGTLYYFVPIAFGGTNTVDCAIATTTTDLLGTGTPPDGYGTPKSTTVPPAVNMAVEKYGRTTSLTNGTITGINATVNVGYSTGTATFVGQIIVQSRKAFIKAGDSGSLLVTNPGTNPVGLLFAGNQNGTYAVANHIGDVLSALGVTIDGN